MVSKGKSLHVGSDTGAYPSSSCTLRSALIVARLSRGWTRRSQTLASPAATCQRKTAMQKSIYTEEYAEMLALLRETRHALKLTQTELADRLAMSQSFVTKYERGETRLDLAQLRVLCHALGTSLLDFVSKYERRLARKRRKG